MLGRTVVGTATVVAVALLSQSGAWAAPAPGSPDPSFGTNGSVVEGSSNSYGGQIYRQPNGEIVFPTELNGQATLIRMNGNGTLDTSFGDKGVDQVSVNRIPPSYPDTQEYLLSRVATGYSGFTVVTEASDGTYYAGGYSDTTKNGGSGESNGFIAHLLSNGLLDPQFGTNGVVTFPNLDYGGSGGPYYCTDVPLSVSALPNDGGVVVANNDCYEQGGVAPLEKFDTSGQADATFAAEVNDHLALYDPTWAAVFNGEVLTDTCPNYAPGSIAVAALRLDGTLDTSWGVDGCSPGLTVPSGTTDGIGPVALGPGNKIMVVADSTVDTAGTTTSDSWMARLSADGQIDPSFGTGTTAMAPTPLNGSPNAAVDSITVSPASGAVVLLAPGRYSDPGYSYTGEVASVLPDGATDTVFGTGGVVDLPSTLDTTGVEVQPDYRVVVSATTGDPACSYGPDVPDPSDASSAGPGEGPYPCSAVLLGYTDTNL